MTTDPDRFALVEALTKAATDLGWRPSLTESSEWRVSITVLAPLASSRPERNRWPHEPEEGPEALPLESEPVFRRSTGDRHG